MYIIVYAIPFCLFFLETSVVHIQSGWNLNNNNRFYWQLFCGVSNIRICNNSTQEK